MFNYPHPKTLIVSSLGLSDPREIQIATIIAEETEIERDRQREKDGSTLDKTKQPTPNRLVGLLYPEGYTFSYADSLKWEELLTFGQCVFECAKRAHLSVHEILEFVDSKCRPDGWLVFWYRQYLRVAHEHATAELTLSIRAKQLEDAEQVKRRIKAGASLGGLKSAQTRRRNSTVPDPDTLNAERQRIIGTGIAGRNVVGVLAKKYGVTPGTIRNAFKRK